MDEGSKNKPLGALEVKKRRLQDGKNELTVIDAQKYVHITMVI